MVPLVEGDAQGKVGFVEVEARAIVPSSKVEQLRQRDVVAVLDIPESHTIIARGLFCQIPFEQLCSTTLPLHDPLDFLLRESFFAPVLH